MQIEQNFRDEKNICFGFSWRLSRSKSIERVSILCLISMIASFLLLLIGFIAEKSKLHYQFQANTIKSRRVLSLIYLGKQIICSKLKEIHYQTIKQAIRLLDDLTVCLR